MGFLLEDLIGSKDLAGDFAQHSIVAEPPPYSTLELLKGMHAIRDFRDLRPTVKEFDRLDRKLQLPDFQAILMDGTIAEIESKNLEIRFKPVKTTKSSAFTEIWCRDSIFVDHEVLGKNWTKGAKRVLVVADERIWNPKALYHLEHGSQYLKLRPMDAHFEAHPNEGQVTEKSDLGAITLNMAGKFHPVFLTWLEPCGLKTELGQGSRN